MKRSGVLAIVALGMAYVSSGAGAAVLYSTVGSTYSQNFDGLPNSPTNTSLGAAPAGWTDDNASPGAGNFSLPVGIWITG